jgi:AcrR family transcriptional regulator
LPAIAIEMRSRGHPQMSTRTAIGDVDTASASKRRAPMPPAGAKQSAPRAPDAESTRRNIIEIATDEFAEKGFSGARIDEIAARTNTSKRMIYYYFTDKEGLFVAVLEEAYRRIRAIEAKLDVDHLEPEAAMRAIVALTFDNHTANEDFVRLVMVENIHRGEHLAKSRGIQELNVSIIDTTGRIYERGVEAGIFRPGVDPIDLHMTMSALCFHMVSNRSTFSRIFKRDMASAEALARRREIVVDTVLRYIQTAPG